MIEQKESKRETDTKEDIQRINTHLSVFKLEKKRIYKNLKNLKEFIKILKNQKRFIKIKKFTKN